MLLTLFVFGSFWFWVLCLAEFILLVSFIENEKIWPANLSIIICAALLVLFSDTNIFEAVVQHPIKSLIYGLGYVATGFVWSIPKYYFLLSRRSRGYEARKKSWLYDRPDSTEDDFIATAKERGYFPDCSFERYYKRIVFWAAYWPFSMFWTFLRNAVVRLFEEIAYRLRGVYESIYRRVFKNIIGDMERSEKMNDR